MKRNLLLGVLIVLATVYSAAQNQTASLFVAGEKGGIKVSLDLNKLPTTLTDRDRSVLIPITIQNTTDQAVDLSALLDDFVFVIGTMRAQVNLSSSNSPNPYPSQLAGKASTTFAVEVIPQALPGFITGAYMVKAATKSYKDDQDKQAKYKLFKGEFIIASLQLFIPMDTVFEYN